MNNKTSKKFSSEEIMAMRNELQKVYLGVLDQANLTINDLNNDMSAASLVGVLIESDPELKELMRDYAETVRTTVERLVEHLTPRVLN